MAFIDQEGKKRLKIGIDKVLKKYGVKGTLSIYHYSKLVCTIRKGKIDFLKDYKDGVAKNYDQININTYHLSSYFTGESLSFLEELHKAMNDGNHDNSDIMTDYFDVGWYVDIEISNDYEKID